MRRVRALLAELDEAAPEQRLAGSVEEITEATAAIGAARHGVHAALAGLDTRRGALLSALQQLDQLEAAITYRRRFDPDGWPERQAGLAAQLAEDPHGGARAWVAAWVQALTAGRFDEAERLVAARFTLPAELGWVVARCSDVTSAAGSALTGSDHVEDLRLGLRRCETLLRWLEGRAPLAGEPSLGDAATLDVSALHAQWAVAAGEGTTGVTGDVPAGTGTGDSAASLGLPPAEVATLEALRAREPREVASLSRRALDGGAGPAAVALLVGALETWAPEEAEREADRWTASLPMLDGVGGRLVALPVPIPPMLWLALARRAVTEAHPDAELLLEAGEEAAEHHRSYLGHVRFELADRRAASLPSGDQDPSGEPMEEAMEVADLYEQAGTDLVIGGDAAAARAAYDRALALVPTHAGALLGRIDAVMVETSDQPLATARPEIEAALAVLAEARSAIELDESNAWSLLDEALLHRKLGSVPDPVTSLHRWLALLAVVRAMAYQVDSGSWRVLATACVDVGAYHAGVAAGVAALAAQESEQLPGTAALDAYLGAAVSVDRAGDVLAKLDALVPDDVRPWHHGVRAYALLLDDPQAARQPAKTALDGQPDSLETRWILASAYTLAGDEREAARQWRALWREAARGDEGAMFQVAAAAMELGYLSEARLRFERLLADAHGLPDDGIARSYLGAVHLLEGDPTGVEELVTAVRSSPTARYVQDIRVLIVKRLGALAGRTGTTLPDLTPIEGAIAGRLAELDPEPAPDAELLAGADEVLATLDPQSEHAATVKVASRGAAGLFRRSRGDRAGARDLLLEAAALAPDITELGLLAASLDVAPPVEPPSVEPSPSGQVAGATDDETVGADADSDVDDVDDVDDYVYEVQLLLPGSWFEGVENPVRDHPLLNHYLPDARDRAATAGVELPPVQVSTLDDDSYQVYLGDELVAAGGLASDRWYVPAIYLPSLPGELAGAAEELPDWPGLVTVPVQADATAATLLSVLPAAEVIARILENALTARAGQADGAE